MNGFAAAVTQAINSGKIDDWYSEYWLMDANVNGPRQTVYFEAIASTKGPEWKEHCRINAAMRHPAEKLWIYGY